MWQGARGSGVGAGGYATPRPRYRKDDARRAPRPRLRRADAGRPRARRACCVSLALAGVAWLGRGLRTVGLSAARRGARRGTPERVGCSRCLAIVRRLRRALVRRLDLVRPRQRRRRAAVRRLAGRPRAAPRADRPAPAARAGALRDAPLARSRRRWPPSPSLSRARGRLAAAALADRRRHDALEPRSSQGNIARRARPTRRPRRTATRSSVEPLFERAASSRAGRQPAGAAAALQEAVRLQPANPRAVAARWPSTSSTSSTSPRRRCRRVGAALYLDPRSQRRRIAIYLQAQTRRASDPRRTPRWSPLVALARSPSGAPAAARTRRATRSRRSRTTTSWSTARPTERRRRWTC